MVYRGMIFQFDSIQGNGLIMLSDGAKKEFSISEWTDDSNMPAVGLEVLYDNSDKLVKIKVLSTAEKNTLLLDEKRRKEDDITSFTSIEEYQTHFSNKGFDIIKNTDETADSELKMGKFCDESVQSISISVKDGKLELTEKTILLSSVEEYIKYFQDIGFRVLNDLDDSGSRKVMLRRYIMDRHGEIIITSNNSKITVTQTENGKVVT